LRRLGASAGVDLDADERDLLAELLDTPALNRAPLGFWRAYRRPLLELAGRSPAVRASLLDRQPGVPGIHDWWLGLLESAGARGPRPPPRCRPGRSRGAARPAGSAARSSPPPRTGARRARPTRSSRCCHGWHGACARMAFPSGWSGGTTGRRTSTCSTWPSTS